MIRRLLGRDRSRSCASCGAALDVAAVWCGSCGARVTNNGASTEDIRHGTEEAGSSKVGGRVMRWGAAGAGLLLVVIIALGALSRSPAPEPLLGRVGSWTGVTASGLPPAGLETVWEQRIGPTGSAFARGGQGIVAGDGLVRVGGVVLDRATGELVGASRISASSRGRLEGRMIGDDLVVVDTLTGQVRSRQTVVRPDGPCCRSVDSVGSGWLVASNRESVIVDSDGAEVARIAAVPALVDRVGPDAAAIPLRRPGQGIEAPIALLDASTGTVVHDGDGGTARIAEVVGEFALVASLADDATFDLRTPQEWEVNLIDARTGESSSRFVLVRGHGILPIGGQQSSPLADSRSPQ